MPDGDERGPGPDAASGSGIICGIADDGSRFPIEKIEAHRYCVLHDAVSIFVFSADELLIQRRARAKYHSGGQWANTCCSHPHWGEPAATCAERRLSQELGFSVALTEGATIRYMADVGDGLWENERVRIFKAGIDRRTVKVRPDPAEVSETRWASPQRLLAEAATDPAAFTPWFRIYLARWPELGL